jgi:signal transduction histidine kinase
MKAGAAGQTGSVTPSDLAELMATFNGVTSRLQETHETLHREVVRLKAELNEANEQLQRSRRLAALGEMAAGIAHEVRNPLGSIGLYARMLEQDLVSLPPQKDIATKIVSAVIGLNGVVGDVLSFARDAKITPEPITADEVFSRAAEACVPGDSIKVVRRGGAEAGAEGDPGLMLWCDSILMHQALVNIIRNAIEAMAECDPPKGGHVLVLDAAEAVGHDGKPAAVLTVSDTGPGVSCDAIDRMFNPFFTTRKTGTGLGLAIVHRIIDAHGGRIVVWNNADKAPGSPGATFELVIPSRSPEPRAARNLGMKTTGKAPRHPRMQEASR